MPFMLDIGMLISTIILFLLIYINGLQPVFIEIPATFLFGYLRKFYCSFSYNDLIA